jgi:hypothetical protein
MANGWASLGNSIAGGNQLPSALAYEQGVSLGANTQDALAQARARVDKNNTMESLDQNLSASIPDPKQRAVIVQSMLAGVDPRNVTGAQSDQFKLGQQQEVANPNTSDAQAARDLLSIGQNANITHAVGDNGNLINEFHPGQVQMSDLGTKIAGATAAKDTAAAAASNSEVPLHAAQATLANAQAAALPGTKEPTKYAPKIDPATGQPIIDPNTNLPVLTDRTGGSADINAPKPMGAREAQQLNRSLVLGQQASRDLGQLTTIPLGTQPTGLLGGIGANLGITGYGGAPGRNIMDSVKADLTNRAAPEAVKQYTVFSSGMARALMGLENPTGQGNSGSQAVLDQFNKLNLLDGDSNGIMLTKLAKQKQIIESSLQEQILNSNRVPQQSKDAAQAIIDSLNKAVPYEPEDINRMNNGPGGQTLGQVIGMPSVAAQAKGAAAPAAAPGPAAPTAPQAPSQALALLSAHPELAPQFKAKYGYLPGAQ